VKQNRTVNPSWGIRAPVKRSTGHTHTTAEHKTAEQTTHTNTERATAQRRLIVEVVVAAPKIEAKTERLTLRGEYVLL